MPVGALGRQYHHADDATRAAVPPDGLLERLLDEGDRLVLVHALLPVRVAVSVDVGRAGAADRVGLLVEGPAEGDAVDLAAVPLVPARNN